MMWQTLQGIVLLEGFCNSTFGLLVEVWTRFTSLTRSVCDLGFCKVKRLQPLELGRAST
jgi:hypothetical protein